MKRQFNELGGIEFYILLQRQHEERDDGSFMAKKSRFGK